MDKEIPSEDEIIDLLSYVNPQPGKRFHQKMTTRPWNLLGGVPNWFVFTPIRAVTSLGLVLLLVIGISFLSPSLNTLAQRFTQFFSPSDNNQIILEISTLATSQPLERFTLTIHEAESLSGFKMKTWEPLPKEFRLVGAAYDDLREAIILHYTSDSEGLVLRFSQQRFDSDYQGIGPKAVVEKVAIRNNPGEFVAGGWMIPEVESAVNANATPNVSQAVWDENVNLQTLRWTDSEFLFEIILAGDANQTGYLDKAGLINLANQVR